MCRASSVFPTPARPSTLAATRAAARREHRVELLEIGLASEQLSRATHRQVVHGRACPSRNWRAHRERGHGSVPRALARPPSPPQRRTRRKQRRSLGHRGVIEIEPDRQDARLIEDRFLIEQRINSASGRNLKKFRLNTTTPKRESAEVPHPSSCESRRRGESRSSRTRPSVHATGAPQRTNRRSAPCPRSHARRDIVVGIHAIMIGGRADDERPSLRVVKSSSREKPVRSRRLEDSTTRRLETSASLRGRVDGEAGNLRSSSSASPPCSTTPRVS
jgi:hypothetical protein